MDLLKTLHECGADARSDGNYDMCDDSVAYELARCLLEDPEVMKAAQKLWPGKSCETLQEIMADHI